MSEIKELPPVAKSVFSPCKKCEADRYHTVLAHKTAMSASVQCEVCGAKSTFRITTARKKTAKKKTTRKKSDPAAKWREWGEKLTEKEPRVYSLKQSFKENDVIDHPKFGVGYVVTSNAMKIEVIFEDEERFLVHNRT